MRVFIENLILAIAVLAIGFGFVYFVGRSILLVANEKKRHTALGLVLLLIPFLIVIDILIYLVR